MFRGLIVSALACVAALAASSVDSTLLALLPPDSTVVSSVSVAQAKNSTFGQYMLSQMQINDPGYQQFVNDTGFDARHDLTLVMSATTATAADAVATTHKALILGRGNFNIAKITSAAKAQGATIQNYKGVDLIVHAGTDLTGAIAFLDPTTAVMGDVASVQGVVDRRGRSSSTLPANFLAQVSALAAANDAWFVSTVSPTVFFNGKISNPTVGTTLDAGLAQSVLAGSGGLKFTATGAMITGQAVARSPQDASALSDVFKFLVNIAQANRGTSNQAGSFASMLDTLRISSQGSNMNLDLQIPESTLEQLFMGGSSSHRSVASSQRASH